MKKVRMGKTDLLVSRIGFGGIPLTRPSVDYTEKLIHRALELGINFFDTANAYGDSQVRLGNALKSAGVNREDIVICTRDPETTKKGQLSYFQRSLEQLQTDYIDIWQIHNVSNREKYEAIFADGGAVEALQELKESGKAKYIGITGHNVDIMVAAVKTGIFDVIQYPFNFVSDEALDELYDLCIEKGVGFIGMKPFAGGRLNKANLAFKYVMRYDHVIPDPGFEKIEELEEVLEIVDSGNYDYTTQEQEEMLVLTEELGKGFCRQCEYCKPCPKDININMLLITKVMYKLWPKDRIHEFMTKVVEQGESCIECGICKTRCPYNLDIPTLIKENIEFLHQMK